MTQIEKIKAEIERLSTPENKYSMDRLYDFIESLEKEQDSELDKLRAAVEAEMRFEHPGGEFTKCQKAEPTKEEQIAMLRLEYEKGRADVLADMANAPKIKGWVARDSVDNRLTLFMAKPYRGSMYWIAQAISSLPIECYPDLKWEDEPIEVELTINKI